MQVIEYECTVLPDGHLSCPDDIKRQLRLVNGSTVKVTVSIPKERKIAKLKGLWQGIEITEKDINVARHEMWEKMETNL